jgi:hypothetical protein
LKIDIIISVFVGSQRTENRYKWVQMMCGLGIYNNNGEKRNPLSWQ